MDDKKWYKVVETDNFNSDYPNEEFAIHYWMNKEQAKEIAKLFNRWWGGNDAPRYWKVVERDYVLHPGFEP